MVAEVATGLVPTLVLNCITKVSAPSVTLSDLMGILKVAVLLLITTVPLVAPSVMSELLMVPDNAQ